MMLGHILNDTTKFLFLFMEFYIPFIMAFWICFGGATNASIMEGKGQSSDGWKRFDDLAYSVWLITVVGDFDFQALLAVDPLMAQVLTGSCIALTGILLLNLFIALMSDTFQRVYDNAKANALLQAASAIQLYEGSLGLKESDQFRRYLYRQCAPEVSRIFYHLKILYWQPKLF